jgi:hypothetical protein
MSIKNIERYGFACPILLDNRTYSRNSEPRT